MAIEFRSGNFVFTQCTAAAPAHGEVRLELVVAGLCGTDLDIIRGIRPESVSILGHEGVARVTDVHPTVSSHAVDDLVVFNPVDPTTRERILGHSFDGVWRTKFTVSAHDVNRGMLVPVQDRLSPYLAVLAEPLGTVIYSTQLLGQQCGRIDNLAVVGCGSIGLLHLIHASQRGARTVVGIDRSPGRLVHAVSSRILAESAAETPDSKLADRMLARTDGVGFDAAIVCTPRSAAPESLSQALRYVRQDGCVILVSGFADDLEVPDLAGVRLNAIRRANHCGSPLPGVAQRVTTRTGKRLCLTGHRGTSQDHLAEAMRVLATAPEPYRRVLAKPAPAALIPHLLNTVIARDRAGQDPSVMGKVTFDFAVGSLGPE